MLFRSKLYVHKNKEQTKPALVNLVRRSTIWKNCEKLQDKINEKNSETFEITKKSAAIKTNKHRKKCKLTSRKTLIASPNTPFLQSLLI